MRWLQSQATAPDGPLKRIFGFQRINQHEHHCLETSARPNQTVGRPTLSESHTLGSLCLEGRGLNVSSVMDPIQKRLNSLSKKIKSTKTPENTSTVSFFPFKHIVCLQKKHFSVMRWVHFHLDPSQQDGCDRDPIRPNKLWTWTVGVFWCDRVEVCLMQNVLHVQETCSESLGLETDYWVSQQLPSLNGVFQQ